MAVYCHDLLTRDRLVAKRLAAAMWSSLVYFKALNCYKGEKLEYVFGPISRQDRTISALRDFGISQYL
uniref:Uncharacterized protein n=1 Tax=Oryza rufipogon TaxID=4529 RepID=A0A0E0N087_ORYRU